MKQRVVFALLMGVITTGLVSFTLHGVNRGFTPGFARLWLKSWFLAYLVVIPIILLVSPLVLRLTHYLIGEPTTPQKTLKTRPVRRFTCFGNK